jgi:hypothetical protein
VQIADGLEAILLLAFGVTINQRLHRGVIGADTLGHASFDGVHGKLAEREHLVFLEPDARPEAYLRTVEIDAGGDHGVRRA